ncbi:GNAT family N-acetyltransferase [Eudoraea adriatica]|uniref:GNAT family N-acetyltransferase n=1 Tax=Eudoraea adriatica TaxID=446681 RepID=UPI00037DCDD3|nr:N-acetyltransferase [Eudoraea adriatica]
MSYTVRFANLTDKENVLKLYKRVSKINGGIARTENEITETYIINNLKKSIDNGISLIVDNPNCSKIIAEIHCYKLTPSVFDHVLSELTIVVDPKFQNQGLGKLLFKSLLKHIEDNRTEILRVELIARESNTKAITFYEKLGFKIEGRFERRINNGTENFEADIPMAWFNKNYAQDR